MSFSAPNAAVSEPSGLVMVVPPVSVAVRGDGSEVRIAGGEVSPASVRFAVPGRPTAEGDRLLHLTVSLPLRKQLGDDGACPIRLPLDAFER
jgi:hypothetical protein